MKLKNILYAMTGLAIASAFTGCDSEKDLVIYDGNLPIKTSSLYMVGDATPNGWSIDSPTLLEATAEDPLVFTWEGNLNRGELKLCLAPGSWDAAFIRPLNNGEEIGKTEITDAAFQMHAGDPDEKWKISEAGVYNLTFDLRNWTMSSRYLRSQDAFEIAPISTDVLYIVGDATPAGWNIDAPVAVEKKAEYIFEYEGVLNAGEFKACLDIGDWGVNFIRPLSEGCKVDKTGVESNEFMFEANPDYKWRVEDAGIYHLTFDLEKYTITTEFIKELSNEKYSIDTPTLYMIGDATPGGWSMDDASAYTVSPDNKYIFTWEGELVEGNMKACLEPDGTFSCPFLRPSSAGVEISSKGVAANDFVYTTGPDDQWRITEAGRYKITFDLENWIISVEPSSKTNN